MKNILCYGDSNTWGFNPLWLETGTRRHAYDVRWTGMLQNMLGYEYRVIEEGLNGRTTMFDDPTAPGRSGLKWIAPCIDSHLPLDLIIIMLGINDTKPIFNASAVDISKGMNALMQAALNPFLYGKCFSIPQLLIAAPVPLGDGVLSSAPSVIDESSVKKSKELAGYYADLAKQHNCHFIDLSGVAKASPVDNMHLSAEAHRNIAVCMDARVREIFGI